MPARASYGSIMAGFSVISKTARPFFALNCRLLLRRRGRDPLKLRFRQCGNLNRSLKLAACSEDIPSPRPPDKRRNSRCAQNVLKRGDPLWARRRKFNSRTWVQGNQVDLTTQSPQQLCHFLRILDFIVHATQQDVLKRDPLPRA